VLILPHEAKYKPGYFALDLTQMVEVVIWQAQNKERQHVEVESYGLAYTLRNIDKNHYKLVRSWIWHYGQLCRSCIPNLSYVL